MACGSSAAGHRAFIRPLGIPGVLGGTTHELNLDDAVAFGRLPQIESVDPIEALRDE